MQTRLTKVFFQNSDSHAFNHSTAYNKQHSHTNTLLLSRNQFDIIIDHKGKKR